MSDFTFNLVTSSRTVETVEEGTYGSFMARRTSRVTYTDGVPGAEDVDWRVAPRHSSRWRRPHRPMEAAMEEAYRDSKPF